MSAQEMIFLGIGVTCFAIIIAALLVTSFWAIFDCALSEDYSKQVKLRWLIVLFIGSAIFIPNFVYGRYITKSRRLRSFTRVAFIALILSVVTICGATLIGKHFFPLTASVKTAKSKAPPVRP